MSASFGEIAQISEAMKNLTAKNKELESELNRVTDLLLRRDAEIAKLRAMLPMSEEELAAWEQEND